MHGSPLWQELVALGIVLAAGGGFLVAKFAPSNRGGAPKPAVAVNEKAK